MRWWPGWDFTKSPFAPGQICDVRTMWGSIRYMVILTPLLWALWHFYEFFVWIDHISEIDPRRQAWHRLLVTGLAIVIYGGGILALIMIPIQRRRAAKSAAGQWYDDPALTREALHGTPDEPVDHKAGAIGASDRARREEKSS